ncbi:hypothetical protein I5R65_10570 [Herbaspirillum sp. AP02]|uniref:hypothetical protein n=1 Tax=unclassified Herbaspirillum TaxID=2624150 RepID=UPI0015DA8420|nr:MULTISPECIES: hypothetical protein [unclassified Herbaspirillum]MBG7619907.1 hypothetical protein [Herbaspirillum sp. AP02]NZD69029.1 hypothetical protein [Herbaspirillum sp. AP21]
MPTQEPSAPQPTAFANPYALSAFGAAPRRDADFADHYASYARESAQLMQQISLKAPQLAAVLEQLNEGSVQRRIELDSASASTAEPALPSQVRSRRPHGSLLDTTASLLSHAFPGVAPLFHGCRAFLQMKMIKNNRQA